MYMPVVEPALEVEIAGGRNSTRHTGTGAWISAYLQMNAMVHYCYDTLVDAAAAVI